MKAHARASLSIAEATERGIERLVQDAESGHHRILLRHTRPVAALVSIERLDELDDARDCTLAAARIFTDEGGRTSPDEVLTRSGLTRAELRQHPAYDG